MLLPADFESTASTSSAIRPIYVLYHLFASNASYFPKYYCLHIIGYSCMIYRMDYSRIVIGPKGQSFCPDAIIDYGNNETVSIQMKTTAKSMKRRLFLEQRSLALLLKINNEQKSRIHFNEPYLTLEKEDGRFIDGKIKIKKGIRYVVCTKVFSRPCAEHKATDIIKTVNKRREKHLEEPYPEDAYKKVFRAARGINDIAKRDFGIADDVLIYYEDTKTVTVNPVFRKT